MLTDMATNLRKRRGSQHRSCHSGRVAELEGIADQPRTADHARQLLSRLKTHETEFKTLHFQLIDSVDEEDTDTLDAEQEVLDRFDDTVSNLTV